jgi:glucose/arabinose dehydrogenase
VPEWVFPAHVAPNAFTFLTKDAFPEHKGDAFVAFHGSWNRSRKIGYRVDRVLFDKVLGDPYGSQMIVGTLSKAGDVLGRPVDCVEAPDGSVLFSCDDTRSIYRISYAGPK